MKCVNCITEEMEKFTVDSRVDGYMDCGNECPKCGLIIWTWKAEKYGQDFNSLSEIISKGIEARAYLEDKISQLEKENAEMRFALEGLAIHLRFDTSYRGLRWFKRISKVLRRK